MPADLRWNAEDDAITALLTLLEIANEEKHDTSVAGIRWQRKSLMQRLKWTHDRVDDAIATAVQHKWMLIFSNGDFSLYPRGVSRAQEERFNRAVPEEEAGAPPLTADSIEQREPKLVRKCRALKPTVLPDIWLVLRAMVFAAYFADRDDEEEDDEEAVRRVIEENPRRAQNVVHVSDLCVELAKPEVAFKQAIKELLRMKFIAVSGWDESKFSFNGKAVDIATLASVILEQGHQRRTPFSDLRRVFDQVIAADPFL